MLQSNRPKTFRLGLTGSIAMGKSQVARFFMEADIPVQDADLTVHNLYQAGGEAVEPISALFPSTLDSEGSIDRRKLGGLVLENDSLMHQLESIVHPLVAMKREQWVQMMEEQGKRLVVLDVPLLFETKLDEPRGSNFDAIAVVSAPFEVQRERALSREGMTAEKLDLIMSRQMKNEEKRRRADVVIDTGCPLEETRAQVKDLIKKILNT